MTVHKEPHGGEVRENVRRKEKGRNDTDAEKSRIRTMTHRIGTRDEKNTWKKEG
jgi:hypothetical protein